ncbi:MAG: aerobic carbon-monoxide dehydrogenase large subunit [Alphaproteobacteria bacterium]|nr:aerobic carbon-monoxide dehydrogenase large subunit [Alphaproteobacteria bacterium]
MRRGNSYIGAPVERVEDLRFLRGRGEYLDDIRRDGQWHAAIFRSPIAHARIKSIDASAALAMPGVHAVFTGKDIGPVLPVVPLRVPRPDQHPGAPYQQPVIAGDVVRYVGEPVAVILADHPELAEDALEGIVFETEALPVVVEHRPGDVGTLLFPETGSNGAMRYTATRGNIDEVFQNAEYICRQSFSVKRQTAVPMETRGLLAEWEDTTSKLMVYGAAKVPFQNRKVLAAMLGLRETAVELIECDVGGGFGVRGDFYPEDFLIAFAAHRYRHPVKWIEDRREHLVSINHARDVSCSIAMACRRDGSILGLRGEAFVDIGAYVRPSITNTVRIVGQFLSGPYRIPNIHVQSTGLVSNKTPAGVFRGPGRFESSFFCERMLDIIAQDLSIDRLEIRRKNLITAQEMPYPLATTVPEDGLAPTSCDSGDYQATLDHCLREFGWTDKMALDGRLVGDRYHGIAVGCFIEGGGAGPLENARMVAEVDGTVSVFVGSSAIGQGLETVLSQIAAEALELPIERIRLLHGSTNHLHEGFGSFASRSTVMGGGAILAAAENFLAQMKSASAARLGVPSDGLRTSEGAVVTPDGRVIALADLAAAGVSAAGSFANSKSTYAYGTAAAHVTVDARTGHVALLDYVVVDDVGRAINPLTLHGQMIGATVQGLGGVFGELLSYDAEGQLLVGTLADYLLPVATDFPRIRAVTTQNHPSPNNPLGAKGAGEGGIIPTGGVIANAVTAALRDFGVQINTLPLTPPCIWEHIQRSIASRLSS